MQGRFQFAPVGCAGAVLAVLAACAAPLQGPTYDEYVARWVDDTEARLVSSWGIPERTHSLQTGGRIVEFTTIQKDEVVCTTRFTVDESGKITKYWYRGKKCNVPRSG